MPSRSESQAAFNDDVGNNTRAHSPASHEEPLNQRQREIPAQVHAGHLPLDDGDREQDNNEPDEDKDINDTDDSVSDYNTRAATSTCRWKHVRSNYLDTDNNSDSNDAPMRARKLVKSRGKPKASDYADDVQDILDKAIIHFKVDLLRVNPYPDRTQELTWAKCYVWTVRKRTIAYHKGLLYDL